MTRQDLSDSAQILLENLDDTVNGTGSFVELKGRGDSNSFARFFIGHIADSSSDNYLTIANQTQGSSRADEVVRIGKDGGIGIGGDDPGTAPNIQLGASDGNITTVGDFVCTDNTKGLVLKSPNGTEYRLTVANDGTLSTSAA